MQTIEEYIQPLIDQEARDHFATEIDKNFSVIAPAGVGKTTAIVQRILTIASHSNSNKIDSRLSKLIVVTYTQKAADEMRLRAYQALLKNNDNSSLLYAFNRAFFGTIHSFCFKLIQSYGSYIGISSKLSIITQTDEGLWYEFLNNQDSLLDSIPLVVKEGLYKHVNLQQLIPLAKTVKLHSKIKSDLSQCPQLDLSEVLNYSSKKNSKTGEIQKRLKHWLIHYSNNSFGLEIPEINQGDTEFKALCAETFAPLWHWLGDASLMFIQVLAKKYQQFRIQKGFITYDDIIDLAETLLETPTVLASMHALNHSIILDEAQDTDPQQFSILLKAVPGDHRQMPVSGHFSMLGDPQQAIYSSRADLPTYLKIHNDFLASETAQTLTFNVTMRCDRAIVDHCNTLFPEILKGSEKRSQINFVSLNPRPWAKEGFVGKIVIDPPGDKGQKMSVTELEKYEASILANKICSLGLKGLNVSDWSQVAILCPRKAWLTPISCALQELNIPIQIHSRDDAQGHNPAYAWLTALLTIVTSPTNSFEILGVLREIFGISDAEIADFVSKHSPLALNIAQPNIIEAECLIGKTLHLLYCMRIESLTLPLSDAVHTIVERTLLKNRLLSLADYKFETLLLKLNQLLIQSSIAEEQGLTIGEFMKQLEDNFYNSAPSETQLDNHIQLFTSHKAKGLEWTVVIVPFLFRSILFPPQPYPQLFSLGTEHFEKIAINNHPEKAAWDLRLNQYRIAELERLLYVTATRPRNSLLWVDDEALFPNSKNSFASLLKVNLEDSNRVIWNSLASPMDIPRNDSNHEKRSLPLEEDEIKEIIPVIPFNPTDKEIEVAKITMNSIVHAVSPNLLSRHDLQVTLLEKPAKDYSPIDYGNWWHTLMQTLPWTRNLTAWQDHFNRQLTLCPERIRGESEFGGFLKSEFIIEFLKQRYEIQTEFPFAFKDPENSIYYEGIIDFLAYSPENNEYLIIDWKTDLFKEYDETIILSTLRQCYAPQLSIYQNLIQTVYKKPTKAHIYSTSLAKLIRC